MDLPNELLKDFQKKCSRKERLESFPKEHLTDFQKELLKDAQKEIWEGIQ